MKTIPFDKIYLTGTEFENINTSLSTDSIVWGK